MGEALLCSSKEPSRNHQIALGTVCLSVVSRFEQLVRLAPCYGGIWGYWLCDGIRTSRRTLGTPGRYTEGHCQFGESSFFPRRTVAVHAGSRCDVTAPKKAESRLTLCVDAAAVFEKH